MPPKVIARNADRTGGVLPVNAAARAASSKAPSPRLKLEIRRLPPGLTLAEFEETLGDDWKLGNGKVDWREYRQGKTRAPGSGKVPELSRCYMHLVSEACVKEFEKRFLETAFQDKAGTHKNPDLKSWQPTLGYAPNQRTPLHSMKQRLDNRQGTIDQDPEYMAFLESETQPITRPTALDSAAAEKESEKTEVKTTPLIEDLREKKANKAKAAQAKAEKSEKDKKTQATKGVSKESSTEPEKNSTKTTQQQKVEQAAKDVAKVANKQAAAKTQQQTQQPKAQSSTKTKKAAPSAKSQDAPPEQPSTPTSPANPAPQRASRRERPRGNANGIKKMLQKDLGLKPTDTALANSPQASPISLRATPASPAQPPPTSTPTAPKGTPNKPSVSSATLSSEAKSPPLKAYLKHANPSQGMTEILIQQALSQYGDLTNVTIDPRKGTAIAVFKQTEGLKKALEAKRVPVASGAVEILEFRERTVGGPSTRGGYRGGRGGRGGARGGAQSGNAASPASASAATTVSSSQGS